MKKLNAMKRACEIVGSQQEMARILKVSPAAVSYWCNGLDSVPAGRCLAIEQATDKQVTRKDLRPKDYMNFWDDL